MLTKKYLDGIRMMVQIKTDLIRDGHCNATGNSMMDKLVP